MNSAIPLPEIVVNGASHTLASGKVSVADLLLDMGFAGNRVAVEKNGEIVPRSLHATTSLAAGDRIEIVVAVGGG